MSAANSQRLVESALPASWDVAWGRPSPFYRRRLLTLRLATEALASDIPLVADDETFATLVGSVDNADAPIHRWYYCKEAFSYRLPGVLLARLGAGTTQVVVDPFSGVGTTVLALRHHPAVHTVVGIEYSPFAGWVGRTKLQATQLSPGVLRLRMAEIENVRIQSKARLPELAAFHNDEIFDESTIRMLISARSAMETSGFTEPEL